MNGATFAFVALTVAALVWLWMAAALRVVFRPRRPREGPATSELRDEPPAVVNLLTHGWTVTASAAAATVLDLARRGVIEIVQVSPESDVVELRRTSKQLGDLEPYERQVHDHLRRCAVEGVVPAAALTTGPPSASDAWWARFRRAVERDARRRGLSQRRFPPAVLIGLGLGVIVLVVWLLIAFSATKDAAPGDGPALWSVVVAVAVVVVCGLAATRFDKTRQRDTDAGLAAASHWLGVRRGYTDVGSYPELPPAAVVLYERHLACAAAMDVAARAIARLPLSAEDDRRAWSSHGGRWRPVTVRYPWHRMGWGEGPGRAIVSGLLWTATLAVPLFVLVRFGTSIRSDLEDFARSAGQVDDPANQLYSADTADRIALGVTWLIVVALVAITVNAAWRGMLRLGRGLFDAGREELVRGTVVRRRTWPRHRSGERVDVHWVAVDDGSVDEIRALALRPTLAGPIHQGDEVELEVSPVLGFVRTARVTASAPPLPPPRAIEDLPTPTQLPPVHWTQKLDAPDPAADDGPGTAADVPALTAALARQLQRLFAALGTRR